MVQKDRHAALMACFLLALVAAQSYTMDCITCTSSNFVFFADGLNLVHFSFTLIPLYVLLGPEQALASAFIHIFPRRSHNMQTARVIKKNNTTYFFFSPEYFTDLEGRNEQDPSLPWDFYSSSLFGE